MKNFQDVHEFVKSNELNNVTELCQIFKEFGSDKSSDWHNYSPLYHELFKKYKNNNINIMECGIYSGASIHSWKKYFPIANIYACDINSNFFINDERVQSFYCNQDNKFDIQNLWGNNVLKNIEFDIIIDDGKHEFNSNLNFLTNSIHKTKKGGLFIVEDLTNYTKSRFFDIINQLKSDYNLSQIEVVDLPNPNNNIDNCILLIEK